MGRCSFALCCCFGSGHGQVLLQKPSRPQFLLLMAFISIYLGFPPTGRLNSSGWMLLVRCLSLSPPEPRKLSLSMVCISRLEIGWWPPSGMEFSRGNANLIAPVYDSVSPRQGFFLLSHQRATAFQIVDHPWEQVNDVQSSYLFYKVTLKTLLSHIVQCQLWHDYHYHICQYSISTICWWCVNPHAPDFFYFYYFIIYLLKYSLYVEL